MNKNIYLALGSNLGDKKQNFITAIDKLKESGVNFIKSSPLYKTPALLLDGSPDYWNIPYLNCVIQVNTNESPENLLKICKKIETEMGHSLTEKWAPRVIDIDILLYKDIKVNSDILTIPHKGLYERYFLIDALSFLDFNIVKNQNIYSKEHQPIFMGIINVNSDSFSDCNDKDKSIELFKNYSNNNVSIIDIGAESTSPNSNKISFEEELNRLNFIFNYIKNFKFSYFKPLLSIDTYHYETAVEALKNGFNIINDVSGLSDERMINLIRNNKDIYYVLTHSLSVPANNNICIDKDIDCISYIQNWLMEKLKIFEKNNIDLNKIIFDPGIGFGKYYFQNIKILANLDKFYKYGLKILVGHSRKSFIKKYDTDIINDNLDFESLAISLKISNKVDIIRTHTPIENQNSLLFLNSI